MKAGARIRAMLDLVNMMFHRQVTGFERRRDKQEVCSLLIGTAIEKRNRSGPL
jgi:hypothetical protein